MLDLTAGLARYRDGAPVAIVAGELGVPFDWLARQIIARNIRRDVPMRTRSRRTRRPELDDPAWLRDQLTAHRDVRGISRQLAVRPSMVRAAMQRHGIAEPATAPRHRTERSDPIARFHAGATRLLRARVELQRAVSLQRSAIGQLQDEGLTIAAIADRFEVDTAVIEDLLDMTGEETATYAALDRTDPLRAREATTRAPR